MSFEEFFKKKKIDLNALKKGEAALFSEFKAHYSEMGEKSFDHTKKYWFNKLRRQFPLAAEIKTEKVHIENQLAEQTITDTLTPPAASAPKVGFTPKFRAGNMAKPTAEVANDKKGVPTEDNTVPVASTPGNTGTKPAFVPRFKMKPKVEAEEPEKPAEVEQQPEVTEVKPAYVPKFKMKPKVEADETEPPAETAAQAEATDAKPAYVPKFKMKPKVEAEETEASAAIEPTPEITQPKPAYVPKFKMKPKVEAEEPVSPPAEEQRPAPESPEAKPAYKPRFNMKNIPPKPQGEE